MSMYAIRHTAAAPEPAIQRCADCGAVLVDRNGQMAVGGDAEPWWLPGGAVLDHGSGSWTTGSKEDGVPCSEVLLDETEAKTSAEAASGGHAEAAEQIRERAAASAAFWRSLMSVHRLLITGSDAVLWRFHLGVALRLNGLERRDQTVLYTCMEDDLPAVIEHARACGATLQRLVGEDGAELLHQGDAPGWGFDSEDA